MAIGNALIGALRVVLGADTAQFDKGMKGASGSLASFAAGAKKHGAIVGAALTAAATGLALAIRSTLKEADKLTKMAQSLGVPVEDLSRLKHAAELGGVAFETMAKGVARLGRNITEAAQGLSTPVRAFEALQISIRNTDGSLKTVGEILPELAERFSKMRDGPEKTAFAMQLLGRAGAELIPMLNQGAAGLKAAMAEADALGITLDQRTGQAAERFNDNLTRIHRVASGLQLAIAKSLLPTLEELSQQFLDVARNGEQVRDIGEKVDAVLRFVAKNAAAAALFISRIGPELIALKDGIKEIFKGNFAKGNEIWKKANEDTEAARERLREWAAELDDVARRSKFQDIAPPVLPPLKLLPLDPAPHIQSAQAIADAARMAAMEFRGMKQAANEALNLLLSTPTETFAAKMDGLAQAVRNGTITWGAFQAKVKKVKEEQIGQLHDLASATASALTTIFGKSKVAAIAAAVINTAQGITKNLAQYPQPLAGIMAAITAASGAAQIAAIKSTNVGGGGATPSAFAGGSGTAAAGSAPQLLELRGNFDANSLWSGDSVRGLIDRLVQAQKDGQEVFVGS